MAIEKTCDVFFTPETEALRFLPEGPYTIDATQISWVGIQHGSDSTIGSLNILNLATQTNTSFQLPGRPGFAFPTSQKGVFVAGVEREIGLFDTSTKQWKPLVTGFESNVQNTIINDAVAFEEGLIFGCKELEFTTPKAGLYFYRSADKTLMQLADNQICSNGKAVVTADGQHKLIDIDSPSKQVVSYDLDLVAGKISHRTVIVDVTSEEIFPDGMILTPDGKSVIVAFYDPADPAFGVARQYSISSGQVEVVWKCPGSPRVTCPQLVKIDGQIRLLLTTAIEGMPPEQFAQHPNAGCLFVGETSFTTVSDQPLFAI